MALLAYSLLICCVAPQSEGARGVPVDPVAGTLPCGALDFVQYYAALELLLEGKNPYDPDLSQARQLAHGRGEGMQMFAPPWGLLPALLVIGLPFTWANIAYVALNSVLLIFSASCWTLLLFPGKTRYLPFTVLAAFLWYPSFLDISFGQNSLWPLAGFTGWLWFTTRERQIPAGVFLALTIIKPHLGLLPGIFAGVYSLRQRRWTTIASFVFTVALATIITVSLRPPLWFEYRAAIETGPSILGYRSHTLHAILYPYGGASLKYFSYSVWFSVILFATLRTWKRFSISDGDPTRTPTLTIWSLIIGLLAAPILPYAWHVDFVFMLPGLILAVGLYLSDKRQGSFGLILWVFMEVWCVLSWVYDHDGFWLVPWMGLASTIWLMRRGLTRDVASPAPTLPTSTIKQ
jgi:hypothetical protein